ncbi:hypothetical protein AABM38_11295 [Heyndrickxia sp. MSNUG]|uniref:hypothetical protein n=1 Tax=Heyndrickxia sp. MSNUG TaxID=3136677 RepID=UPI003C2FDE89
MTEISDTFTKTVGEVIFSVFNKAGIELEQDWPSFQEKGNKNSRTRESFATDKENGQQDD